MKNSNGHRQKTDRDPTAFVPGTSTVYYTLSLRNAFVLWQQRTPRGLPTARLACATYFRTGGKDQSWGHGQGTGMLTCVSV